MKHPISTQLESEIMHRERKGAAERDSVCEILADFRVTCAWNQLES